MPNMGSSDVQPGQMSVEDGLSDDVSKEAMGDGVQDAAGDASEVDERFQITNSLVRHVVADDIDMQNTAAGVVQAEAVSLQQGLTGIAAGHEVSVTEGATWLVVGGSVDTNYSVSQWIVGGQIEAEQVASGGGDWRSRERKRQYTPRYTRRGDLRSRYRPHLRPFPAYPTLKTIGIPCIAWGGSLVSPLH